MRPRVKIQVPVTYKTDRNMVFFACEIGKEIIKRTHSSSFKYKYRNSAIRELNSLYDGELKHGIFNYIAMQYKNNKTLMKMSDYCKTLLKIIPD